MLSSLAVPATVDVVSLAGDVLRVIAKQPGNEIAALERRASPLDLAFPVHLTTTGRSRLILHGPVDDSRADAVDADLSITDLLRR